MERVLPAGGKDPQGEAEKCIELNLHPKLQLRTVIHDSGSDTDPLTLKQDELQVSRLLNTADGRSLIEITILTAKQ